MPYFRQRGDTWSFTVDIGTDRLTGARKQKTVSGFSSEPEARKACDKLMIDIENGRQIKNKTVEQYATIFYEEVVVGQVEDSTYQNQWIWARDYIFPSLGKKKIDKVDIDDIQKFYALLQKKGVSRGTIRNVAMVLKKIFREAEGKRDIMYNPTKFVKVPTYKPPRMNVWSIADVKKFTEIASGIDHYLVYMLGLYSGMRIGEMLALNKTDFDLPNANVSIDKTLKHSKLKGLHIKDPKTPNSFRTVKLPKFVVELLSEHISKIPPGINIVFHKFGNYMYPSCVYRDFIADCKRLGMPIIRIHDLRHTHVTMLFSLPRDRRPNAKTVADRIGDTVQTVLNTYAHVLKDLQDEVADTLDFIQ